MPISEWLNDVVWDAKGSVPISPEWFDRHAGNGKQVNLTLTCPFCDTSTHLSCGKCGNDVLTTERCGSHFIFNCDNDNNQVVDLSYCEDMDEKNNMYKEKTLRCPRCGSQVPTSLFCEISYASIDNSLRQLHKKTEKEIRELTQTKKIGREKAIPAREMAFKFLSELMLTPGLILGSDIWMNPGYDPFFKVLGDILLKAKKVLTMYSPQFDEICELKRKTRYGNERNRGACRALGRIERLQSAGLLDIEPLTIDVDEDANIDHLIIKLIMAQTSHGTDISFLSDDMELRIRARSLTGRSASELFIFQGLDFLPMCRNYCSPG